jgi:small subunit ribosomal protein S8
LKEEGFIKSFKVITDDLKHEVIRVFLKYDENRKGIVHIRRVSKPGRRIYTKTDRIPPVMGGLGLSILSTPKGVLTDRSARKAHVGGEILCTIW